jgi:hypothetical protein
MRQPSIAWGSCVSCQTPWRETFPAKMQAEWYGIGTLALTIPGTAPEL